MICAEENEEFRYKRINGMDYSVRAQSARWKCNAAFFRLPLPVRLLVRWQQVREVSRMFP